MMCQTQELTCKSLIYKDQQYFYIKIKTKTMQTTGPIDKLLLSND